MKNLILTIVLVIITFNIVVSNSTNSTLVERATCNCSMTEKCCNDICCSMTDSCCGNHCCAATESCCGDICCELYKTCSAEDRCVIKGISGGSGGSGGGGRKGGSESTLTLNLISTLILLAALVYLNLV